VKEGGRLSEMMTLGNEVGGGDSSTGMYFKLWNGGEERQEFVRI